jgi:hypothetical protein
MNKTKEVNVEKEDGSEVKIVVKRPNAHLINKAQKIGAKVWTESVKSGLFTKISLHDFMKANGIWDENKEQEQHDITDNIRLLERQIALGVDGKKLKVSEGKRKAIEIRQLRIKLRQLISEKIALESNTAEGLADNAKFNFLVANCTYDHSGQKVYKNIEDYDENSDDEVAFAAAATLGQMMYNLDSSYEEELPENQFLKKFNLVDEDLSLVDKSGNRVDVDGTKVNDKGWLVNDDGERINRDGNLLNEQGQIILQAEYEDDLTDTPKPKATRKKKTE